MENAVGQKNVATDGSLPSGSALFDEQEVIKQLKRYLPAQAPLKDFIFQNSLESFQEFNFFKGVNKASEIFGYKVFLSLKEFRFLFEAGHIREDVLDRVIAEHKGQSKVAEWKEILLTKQYDKSKPPRIGSLRSNWKKKFRANLDSMVHPSLFRILCCYLDQGISIWNFPIWQQGFILSVKEMERNSFTSFFKTERPRKMLLEGNYDIEYLLSILVGDPAYYKQYLFDQQFGHQGWSGMVSVD